LGCRPWQPKQEDGCGGDSQRCFVLATICTAMPFITDSKVRETVVVVAWKATKFCKDVGLQWVIIEGDELEIVYALRQGDSFWR